MKLRNFWETIITFSRRRNLVRVANLVVRRAKSLALRALEERAAARRVEDIMRRFELKRY